MPKPNEQTKHSRQQMPILARHGVSLAMAFVLGLILSYFAGQFIHQEIQLGKLNHKEQATFNEGLAYVVQHAGHSETVTSDAIYKVSDLPDAARAADLLLAIAKSHATREEPTDPIIPAKVSDAIAPLMQRLEPKQAIGLYDGLVQINGINPIDAANNLLISLDPISDTELLQIVDLLDTRLLWSRQWAPLDLWVHWLSVLANSEAELTQFNTAKRIGELPEAVDDVRVAESLAILASSEYDTVRASALNACAGYAALATDPTDYEQIIFELGKDPNKIVARRAWMIVGHLNPFSGFAVEWQDADPFVAEAMLWAAVKTNPDNPKPAWDAFNSHSATKLGILALSAANHSDTLDRLEAALLENQSQYSSLRILCALSQQYRPHADMRDWVRDQISGADDSQPAIGQNKRTWTWSEHAGLMLAAEYYAYPRTTEIELDAQMDAGRVLANLEGLSRLPKDMHSGYKQFISEQSPFLLLIGGAAGLSVDLQPLDIAEICRTNPASHNLAIVYLLQQYRDNALAKDDSIFTRSADEELRVIGALIAAILNTTPQVITGVTANLLRQNPDLTDEQLRAMTDSELTELRLLRVDALSALLEAAEAAPPSANRSVEAKLLKLALWMRGDLGEAFTPTAEAMLFDKELPTSTVLLCLLHMQRPVALDYLFGDLVTPRPDLHKLFIQERYWHVFRRFVDTADLTLWLWGDPEAQAFQLEAMQQWYAVNRWKIEGGWWPEVIAK